jgi:tetratricopeptide (TPR) repeat protein
LETYFLKMEEKYHRQVDDRLSAIAKTTEVLVMMVQTNVQNGRYKVVLLTKNTNWQQITWEWNRRSSILEESVAEGPTIQEEFLKTLSSKAGYVDASDMSNDASSVYVLLRYRGKYSRFAVYDPNDVFAKGEPGSPVAAALKSLLVSMQICHPYVPYDYIPDMTKKLERNPENIEVRLGRGDHYHSKGNYDAAIDDYTEVILRKKDSLLAYLSRGYAYQDKKKFKEAVADFTKAIQLDDVKSEGYKFMSYWHRGMSYESLGNHEKAIADFTECIRIDPDHVKVRCSRGDAYVRTGELDKAIADYTKAIRHAPRYIAAYSSRAAAYRKKGEISKADEDIAKAKKLQHDIKLAFPIVEIDR